MSLINEKTSKQIDKLLKASGSSGRDLFMHFFRSDGYNEQLSVDDCLEVFVQSLKGSSDITPDLIIELCGDYDIDAEELAKGILAQSGVKK